MKIGELIAKAAKGEALTEEERKALAEFDLQKQIDASAAAARKEAEAKADQAKAEAAKMQKQIDELNAAIKAKDDAGKSDLERAQEQVATFAKQLKDLQGKVEQAEQEKTRMLRSQQLDEVRRNAKLDWIDGVDSKILQRAFEGAFEGIDDLGNEDVVKPVIATFRALNKGVIRDPSGPGSGNPLRDGTGVPPIGKNGKPVDQMTAEEREKDLGERGLLG